MNVRTLILKKVAHLARLPWRELTEETPLRDVIHDSFDMIDVVIDLQERTGVRLDQYQMRQISTVGDLVRHFGAAA